MYTERNFDEQTRPPEEIVQDRANALNMDLSRSNRSECIECDRSLSAGERLHFEGRTIASGSPKTRYEISQSETVSAFYGCSRRKTLINMRPSNSLNSPPTMFTRGFLFNFELKMNIQ
jgi:hypothetical protein